MMCINFRSSVSQATPQIEKSPIKRKASPRSTIIRRAQTKAHLGDDDADGAGWWTNGWASNHSNFIWWHFDNEVKFTLHSLRLRPRPIHQQAISLAGSNSQARPELLRDARERERSSLLARRVLVGALRYLHRCPDRNASKIGIT